MFTPSRSEIGFDRIDTKDKQRLKAPKEKPP